MRTSLSTLSAVLLVASAAMAQQGDPNALAPLPDSPQQRITPETADPAADSMYTTHDVPKPLPWQQPVVVPKSAAPSVEQPMKNGLPASMPFGRAEAPAPIIPNGPHSTVAVPVVDVDRVEASEPAPATPPPVGADPAKEDPAQPTELTSPMFDATKDNNAPRKIILRVLNKVTAQSALLEAKPGELIKFGQLEIDAVMCRASLPTSQTDYAGLLDIREHLPGKEGMKQLFRGWMYASSPSISGLEHPVYDVTMIECKIAQPAPKADEKPEKKADKKAGKKP